MNLDDFIVNLNNVKIKKFQDDAAQSAMLAISTGGIGVFSWTQHDSCIYFTDKVYELLSLDKDYSGSVLDVLQKTFEKSNTFKLLRKLMRRGKSEEGIEIVEQIFSQAYHGLRTIRITGRFVKTFEQERFVGTIQDITDFNKSENENTYSSEMINMLRNIPLPLFLYDDIGNLIFTNELPSSTLGILNKLIEQYLTGQEEIFKLTPMIKGFEILMFDPEHRKFKFVLSSQHKESVVVVHRISISHENTTSNILYLSEDITESETNESKMHKILKVNELIIKIKDTVEHVDDLQILYDFVLSQIHTVIPAVKRACILKLDNDNHLFMTANYGYDKLYQNRLHLPFESSFANLSLKGNYTKTIIINDVQQKFSVLYPDINDNQGGFKMESNMVAPLMIEGKLYGLLSVDSDHNNIFDDVDLNLVDYLKIQLERSIARFKFNKKLQQDLIIDPLTGIFNRRHLDHVFENYVHKALRVDCRFIMVIFDIDDLKITNDTYGHLAGDRLLKQFASLASKEVRDIDMIARFGGDEFIGIFWDISEENLKTKLNNWRYMFADEPVLYKGSSIITAFSYGMSIFPDDGRTFDNLLITADTKMYDQKLNKNEAR